MTGKQRRTGAGGWLFLAIVLIAYGLSFLLSPELTQTALAMFLNIVHQILPVLGAVFLLLLIADLLLAPVRVQRYLGTGSGLKGWMIAVIAGILSVGPVYAWYAVLAELKQKGMRPALAATFLYSRAVKLPLLPLMIFYFGLPYTLVVCLYLVVFSVINGLLVERLVEKT